VWSCEPRRFEVPVAQIPVLARMPALAKLELSPSGSRIRWPEADVDINLDTIREYADPDVRREHETRARQEASRYAKAIRQLREERGLKQADIEGLTERQVRWLEEGGHGASDRNSTEARRRARDGRRRLPAPVGEAKPQAGAAIIDR